MNNTVFQFLVLCMLTHLISWTADKEGKPFLALLMSLCSLALLIAALVVLFQ